MKTCAWFSTTVQDCVDCKQCDDRYPQHLPVSERLRKAHEMFAG